LNGSGKGNFASTTSAPTGVPGHLVHWLSAKIHEITTERTKRIEKIVCGERRNDSKKCFLDGAVESRICLIEKSPGSRWRLSHKQDVYTLRTVMFSEAFSATRIRRAIIDTSFEDVFHLSQS